MKKTKNILMLLLLFATNISATERILFCDFDSIALTEPAPQYEAVDLGLGVKWATFNVGATKPEEYGGYYSWGETEEKEIYDFATYKWCSDNWGTITKYCIDSNYGIVDKKEYLYTEDDVATVKWGANWRTPTYMELQQLVRYCTWEWTTLNGINGYKVTGPSGNSIFLPAAGYRYGKDDINTGLMGNYWVNSLYRLNGQGASGLEFNESGIDNAGGYYRCYGLSVRPVEKFPAVAPEFPGGLEALQEYLKENVVYPKKSRNRNSQGRVIVNFFIETDGSIQDISILKSSGDVNLDNEAIRVVKNMPKWSPGKHNGENVRVLFTLPVVFRLTP